MKQPESIFKRPKCPFKKSFFACTFYFSRAAAAVAAAVAAAAAAAAAVAQAAAAAHKSPIYVWVALPYA